MRGRTEPPGGRIGRPPLDFRARPPTVRLLLVTLLVAAVALIQVNIAGYAFTLAGLSPGWAAVVLVLSLLGSAVNVPVARLNSTAHGVGYRLVDWFGRVYIVPVGERGSVAVAVNVGGAIIPTVISIYLIVRGGLWVLSLVAIAAVAVVVHVAARPVHGIGIAVPMLVPAVAATTAALLLHPQHGTAALAYIAGTLGTLIGADLTHLRSVRGLAARAVSIGGAGTFDGVFLSGVLAVLLAAFL
jgi:uncharacterized membrane protein